MIRSRSASRPRWLTLLLAAAAFLLAAASAAAAPAVSREIPLPGIIPHQLTLGPDGNVWVAAEGDADVVRIAPDGTVTPYRNARLSGGVGISGGPDGRLWITRPGEVVRFDPADPERSDTAFPIAGLDPRRIVSDGRSLWTASGDTLHRIDTAGVATPIRVTGMGARGVAVGGDGRIWIADFGGGRIVAVDPLAPAAQAFFDVGFGPQEVAAGAGTQMAYTNPTNVPQQIGRIAPPGGPLRSDFPVGTDPFGITLGDDGAYWAADFGAGDLTRITTDGVVSTLRLSPASGPRWITRGNGGTLWVALEGARAVALVSGVEPILPQRTGPPPLTDPPILIPPRTTPPDTTRPQISGATAGSPKAGVRFVTVRFTLSERASVTAKLQRRAAGRQRGRSCVAPSRRLRRARACTRWLATASATAKDVGGAVSIVLRRPGRRAFAAGSYRILLSARDAAGNTTPATVRLTVRAVKRRR